MSKYFEVYIFTASQGVYANAVINQLDPENKYISQRIFRENCINHKNMYIKDLSIFRNIDQKDLILVDNSSFSFCKNLRNGVPIIPFYDDKNDRELLYLMEFLQPLATVDDVRVKLQETFFYDEYPNYQDPSHLIQFLQSTYSDE